MDNTAAAKKTSDSMTNIETETQPIINNIQINSYQGDKKNILAYVNADIENTFIVKGISIRTNKDGKPYVQLPQKKIGNEYKDVVIPLTATARKTLTDAILDAYANGKSCYSVREYVQNTKLSPILSNKNLKGNTVALGTLYVNDTFAITSVSVTAHQDKRYVNLPQYKKKDDSYDSFVIPTTKESYKALSKELLSAEAILNNVLSTEKNHSETPLEKSRHTDKDADGNPDFIDSSYTKTDTDTLDKDADGRNDRIDSQYNAAQANPISTDSKNHEYHFKTLSAEQVDSLKQNGIPVDVKMQEGGDFIAKYPALQEKNVSNVLELQTSTQSNTQKR